MDVLVIILLAIYSIWMTAGCYDYFKAIEKLKEENNALKAELDHFIKCNHKKICTVVLNSVVTTEEIGKYCYDCNSLIEKKTES